MYRFGFIIEQALGHITHGKNLQQYISGCEEITAEWALIPWEVQGWAARIPLYRSNWTVRAGLRARRRLAEMQHAGRLDAVLFHTQVTATLSADRLSRIPAVVSLDATPLQYDRLGDFYSHQPGPGWLESWKWRLQRDVFRRAARLVTWSNWARQSLVNEYDVPPEKVQVIPPGVDLQLWAGAAPEAHDNEPVRILFVGGNLERKGGLLLLEAFRRLRRSGTPVELHMVTRDPVPPDPGVFVYHDMRPNSPELVQLYQQSDIFCLPTYGDCLPLALIEAAAAGLPAVATQVGALAEVVQNEQNGLLIPSGDPGSLWVALRRLVENRDLRQRMSQAARLLASRDFDAAANACRLVELMKEAAAVTAGQARSQPPRNARAESTGRAL